MKKIAVIGFGAAAIGFLWQFRNNGDYEIDVFEKGKDVMSSSLSGIRSDGKIIMSEEMGSSIHIPLSIQKEAMDLYLNESKSEMAYKTYKSFDDMDTYLKFYNAGFQPIKSEIVHIGTDKLKYVIPNLYNKLCESKNISIFFDCNIKGLKHNWGFNFDEYYIENDDWSLSKGPYDYVIIAVGRSGYKLVDSLIKNDNGLIHKDNKQIVDIGIRFELPEALVADLNNNNYEWKVKKYNNETGHNVRTFCHNRQGVVCIEQHSGFKTVNGHSFHDESKHTSNSNFAILVSTEFTEPFNNPSQYAENIALISNQLAGGNKIMLQKLGDFLEYKRTKRLGRVRPTLSEQEYTLCNINLAMPSQIRQSLVDFIESLSMVVHGIDNEDNLLYFSEVKFYGNKTENSNVIHFMGDCSGKTRSICHASAHGIMTAREILNNEL